MFIPNTFTANDLCRRDYSFDRRFSYSKASGREWLTLDWSDYPYDIDLQRIPSPLALLEWVAHISDKGWQHTTPERIAALIQSVCEKKGWKLHGAEWTSSRVTPSIT